MDPMHAMECLVLGCGNPLLGDDGFGPAVVEYLESHCQPPPGVACVDAGTAVRDILFDLLLSEAKPRRIIVVDAADEPGRSPGEIFEIHVDRISPAKICDFSLHQFPTTNMLKEIHEGTSIDVRVLVAQVASIPSEVAPGLSKPVTEAIPLMCQRIMEIVNESRGG